MKVYEAEWKGSGMCYYRELASTPEKAHEALTAHRASVLEPRITPPLSAFKPLEADNIMAVVEESYEYGFNDVLIITERTVL